LTPIIDDIQNATNLFTQSVKRLKYVIDIFDPELGEMLNGIQAEKIKTFGIVDFVEIKMIWGASRRRFCT
jgi:hypothetical protein